MSELLSTVRSSCENALVAIMEVSEKAPGSITSKALMLGALVGLLTYQLMKKRYRLPPGPRPLPLLGNTLHLRSKEESFYVTLGRWAKEKYGPVITVYLGPMRCVTLNSVDVVREAMVERGTDFAGRPYLYSMDLLTEGSRDIAFATISPTWKLHRKISMQALRHYMGGPFLEKVAHDAVTLLTDKMAAEPGAFDPHEYNRCMVFQILSTVCFGPSSKNYDDPFNVHLMEMFDRFVTDFGNGLWEDVLPLLKYWPTKRFTRILTSINEFMSFIYGHLDYHRKTFSADNMRDLLDTLLLAQKEAEGEENAEALAMLTDTHLGQTIADLFGAGIDTTRLTLDWLLLFMAGNPEIQKRAQAEIDAATGSRMPGLKDRPCLQYTEAVLHETMRMGTVVPIGVPHMTICDSTVGGYDVPKDTMVWINMWAVMHDPEWFPEPEEFRPERFLDKDGKLKKVESWIPFSMGRRACLGESIAKPELVMLTACLLKRFNISLPPGAVYDPSYQVVGIASYNPKPYKIVVTSRQ